ncbi:Quinone oxidoreductase-like protein 2-like protein [Apiospora kogelbergensis]|uniref:Quinone oxidoreductase-like protein 2-like protein n=1 Tax=Apiospora kogelbergensis TaxID=1337665 RepID=UPI00312FFCAB
MKGIQVAQYVKVSLVLCLSFISLTRSTSKGPKELKVTELADPKPGPDDYLIEVHAAATNFFDILQIQGKYQHQPPFPWVSGAEFSGIQNPPKFPVGSRVFGASQGAYASQVCAREAQLLAVPAGWSFADAAGLFVTAPTSYGALVLRAGVKAGDIVLVHAAAGGVGLAAVQVAKAFGATVIATAGSPRKLEVARAFGADHVVDYRDPTWPDQVKKLTPAAAASTSSTTPTKCIAWNGRILVVGFAAGSIEKVAMNKVLLKNISLVGIHWGQYAVHEKESVPVVWEGIGKLIAQGKFRGTTFTDNEYVGLERIPDALLALGGRETWGKVVVKVPQGTQSKL